MTKSASLSRHPWTTSVVWGWRLELQLGAATAALQLLSLDISPVGPILVLVALIMSIHAESLPARTAESHVRQKSETGTPFKSEEPSSPSLMARESQIKFSIRGAREAPMRVNNPTQPGNQRSLRRIDA